MEDALLEAPLEDLDPHVLTEDREVGLAPGAVGQDQRQHRGSEDGDARGRLQLSEAGERPDEGSGNEPVRGGPGSMTGVDQRRTFPAEPSDSQAATTRAAIPCSAFFMYERGSWAFLSPTSPSTLRTPASVV